MELLVGIGVVILVLYFVLNWGFKFGLKAAKEGSGFASSDVKRNQATDRNNLLTTWRREAANILIWRDPDRHLSLYRALHSEVSAYKQWKPQALQGKYAELAKRYPLYEDFDPLGTRVHVLYVDSTDGTEELEGKYADLTRFQGILCATNDEWQWFHATTDDDLRHLTEYVTKIKDTKFYLRLRRAIDNFYIWRAGNDDSLAEGVFEYRDITIRRVSHFAENRFGVHFKDTNEYGLYGFFVDDKTDEDGMPRIYYSHYRSNSSFENEHGLDCLYGVVDWFDSSILPRLGADKVGEIT